MTTNHNTIQHNTTHHGLCYADRARSESAVLVTLYKRLKNTFWTIARSLSFGTFVEINRGTSKRKVSPL